MKPILPTPSLRPRLSSLLIAIAILPLGAASAAEPVPPDLTQNRDVDRKGTYNLGPTGNGVRVQILTEIFHTLSRQSGNGVKWKWGRATRIHGVARIFSLITHPSIAATKHNADVTRRDGIGRFGIWTGAIAPSAHQ